jgi:lysophospholipase L1-like esterase
VPARFIDVPPAQRLQQLVGPRYDVQLRAESGASIQQILLGDKNWPWAPFAQQIEADHPSIVLLRFGGADGLYGTDREAFRADLVEIVREAKSHGVAVYLVGVIRTAQYEEVASAFDQINRDVAQAEGVTFINLRDLAFDQATDTTTDRLHPSQAYSDRIVQRIADVVTSTNP